MTHPCLSVHGHHTGVLTWSRTRRTRHLPAWVSHFNRRDKQTLWLSAQAPAPVRLPVYPLPCPSASLLPAHPQRRLTPVLLVYLPLLTTSPVCGQAAPPPRSLPCPHRPCPHRALPAEAWAGAGIPHLLHSQTGMIRARFWGVRGAVSRGRLHASPSPGSVHRHQGQG